MPYITSIERNGEIRIIIRQLNRRVGKISQAITAKIEELPIEQLEQLGEDLLDFNSSQDLTDWFQRYLNLNDSDNNTKSIFESSF
jgi:Domain of unknown function (DUF4351)